MENIVESILKKIIIENEYNEDSRNLSKKTMEYINGETDKLARELYGDEYDKYDKTMQGYFPNGEREIRNNVDTPTGIFSLGNAKLSDDTLIINFNSALGCPSINDCPITQMACYAVAGENRLVDTRRKHILVQKLVNAARRNNMLEGIFRIAELYIIAAKRTKSFFIYTCYRISVGLVVLSAIIYRQPMQSLHPFSSVMIRIPGSIICCRTERPLQ